MTRNHDIVTIEGDVLHETERAYLFTNGDFLKDSQGNVTKQPKAQWISKSLCEWDAEEKEMQMPEWLALEKKFI